MTCTHAALVVLTEKWGKIGSKTQNCMLEFQNTYMWLQHISQENFNKMSQWWKLQFIFVSCLWETPAQWKSIFFWSCMYFNFMNTPSTNYFRKISVFVYRKDFEVLSWIEMEINIKMRNLKAFDPIVGQHKTCDFLMTVSAKRSRWKSITLARPYSCFSLAVSLWGQEFFFKDLFWNNHLKWPHEMLKWILK